MGTRLTGKRAFVTSADRYMGPAIVELFAAEGAEVIGNVDDIRATSSPEYVISDAGHVDILVVNLAEPPHLEAAHEVTDAHWLALFDALVHPLMRLVRAVLPQMIERRNGAIVAVTSAAPLKGLNKGSAYCAARGAQNAYVRAVGLEVARHNVRVNAIAQNYVANDIYYPPDLLADAAMLARMKKAIPAGRIAEPSEAAELALFLASDASRFMAGQVVPFAGGWATNT
jgi:NAD(P)-dependent dehydrogenase (short-subunit alcohol dehydrogenase family)